MEPQKSSSNVPRPSPFPERHMIGLKERRLPNLKYMIIFWVLDKVTGHSKPINREPMSSYSIASAHSSRSPSGRKMSNYQPPPLTLSLSRRRDSITLPLQNEGIDSSDVQAPLLAMPKEVLARIIGYVLGGRNIHIVKVSKTGNAGVCISKGEERDTLLPLLQTCRRTYVEAINMLYKTNTFYFDSMEALITFSTSVVPRRFDAIRRLQLNLRFDKSSSLNEATPANDYARWERMWRIIGSMKSLQRLRVKIYWWRNDLTGAEEARYLGELLQVGNLEEFKISLPMLRWNDPKDKEVGGTFEVVRTASSLTSLQR